MKILTILVFVFITCNDHRSSTNYFDSVSQNDIKLKDSLPGDWRFEHHESYQTFDDYKKLDPKKAISGKTKIYLVALGNFSGLQLQILQLTREYIEIFFQLKTEFLEPISDQIIPDSAKRINSYTNAPQLYTAYILEHLLKEKIPKDGYALMAISEKDLYPSPDWNFVFGFASYQDRIGVSSISRYQGNGLDSTNFTICLKRLIGTASHEIGHMFSIYHCLFAKCSMNGSNSLSESDKQPLRLCSECQRKLNWNIKYDNGKRLTELINYLRRNKLQEDLLDLEKDNNSLK